MANTCKNCEHWATDNSWLCNLPNLSRNWANHPSVIRLEAPVTHSDGSYMELELFTGPDFGCNQFKERSVNG